MNKTEVMKKLKSLGSEQTRKTFARHGISGNFYGVSYADLYKLQKAIKCDHKLAEQLWSTGVHDARILATMIADPSAMTVSTLDAWCKAGSNQLFVDAIARLAAASPKGESRMRKWIGARSDWVRATGWHVVSLLTEPSADALTDDDCVELLERIEAEIGDAPNRTRYSMNTALISIGVRNAALQKLAIAAAKRIGPVEVDHGDTSCKTPEAVSYIKKVVAHRKKKASKKKTTKKASKTGSTRKKKTTRKAATKKATTRKRAVARA